MRWSHVVTAESPRKLPARRKAEIIASCSASAASSAIPERAHRDRPQPLAMAREQYAERVVVTIHMPPEQLGVGRIVTWLRCQCEPRTMTL